MEGPNLEKHGWERKDGELSGYQQAQDRRVLLCMPIIEARDCTNDAWASHEPGKNTRSIVDWRVSCSPFKNPITKYPHLTLLITTRHSQASGGDFMEEWRSLWATRRDPNSTRKSHSCRRPKRGRSQNPQAKPYQMSYLSRVKNTRQQMSHPIQPVTRNCQWKGQTPRSMVENG